MPGAAPSNTSSRLHAAVILYFAAPGCAHTVSDRDWCKINTSQECDVLIKSLCCSDRSARRVRGGLQRGPLWSCQVWPSKADEAVRLLICLYWRTPGPPRKPSPLFVSQKKYICSPSKAEATGSGCGVEGQIHFESKFSSFCNLFLLRPLPFSPATIQLKLRLNWQQLLKRLAARWSSGAVGWHLSGLVYAQGSARALTPRTHSLRRYHESVPHTEIKMWKAARLKAFLAPHGISFLCDSSSETAFFFHVSFFFLPLDYLTTCEQSCQGETCLIDRAWECLSQHGVKFDFLHVHCASLQPVIALAWCFLMDQLSIITCCEAKHNSGCDTCHNHLLV